MLEMVERQMVAHMCGEGLTGLQGLERQEKIAMVRAQLVSLESVRRQVIMFCIPQGIRAGANRS